MPAVDGAANHSLGENTLPSLTRASVDSDVASEMNGQLIEDYQTDIVPITARHFKGTSLIERVQHVETGSLVELRKDSVLFDVALEQLVDRGSKGYPVVDRLLNNFNYENDFNAIAGFHLVDGLMHLEEVPTELLERVGLVANSGEVVYLAVRSLDRLGSEAASAWIASEYFQRLTVETEVVSALLDHLEKLPSLHLSVAQRGLLALAASNEPEVTPLCEKINLLVQKLSRLDA